MRFQLTAAWPRLTDTFTAADETGRAVYTVRAKTLSLRDSLTIRDAVGQPVARLQAGWLGGYRLTLGDREVGVIVGGPRPRLERLAGGAFTVTGDIAGREYKLADQERVLATVSRRFFSLTDCYGLDVPRAEEALLAVAVAVALHRLQEG